MRERGRGTYSNIGYYHYISLLMKEFPNADFTSYMYMYKKKKHVLKEKVLTIIHNNIILTCLI